MRAVNVDAFMPCSVAETQYTSSAFASFSSAAPRQRIRNCSAAVFPCATSEAGTGGSSPRSDWATIESAAEESRARSCSRLVCIDVHELPETPRGRERRQRGLQVDTRVAAVGDRLDPARAAAAHPRAIR